MKLFKILLIPAVALLVVSSNAIAGDFGWIRDFNIQAKSDPSEFRAGIATRFNLNDVQVAAVRTIFDNPADAYIMLRLGEMQGMLKKLSKEQGIAAIKKYRSNKGKGWDALAKSLGIDPGAKEFIALKHGHDLHGGNNRDRVAYSDYDPGHVNYVDNDLGKGEKRKSGLNN